MSPIRIPKDYLKLWLVMMENEGFTYFRAIFALAFVIGLIYLFAAVVRKTGFDKKFGAGNPLTKRLSVSETMYLDPKRRLVLVKDGTKEHLLLLGATSDIVIESRPQQEEKS